MQKSLKLKTNSLPSPSATKRDRVSRKSEVFQQPARAASGTDFTEARVAETNFAGVDLSVAKGLETINHWGPSTIGIDTIYKSRGKIPEVFLRGCGVPENLIGYMRSLVVGPIEFYSCFISYSHEDKLFARRLHD